MRRVGVLAVFLAMALGLWAGVAVADKIVTITGEVTDNFEIITADGDLYEVSENEQGDALMDHVGETVEAKGTLTEQDGIKTITIASFKVISQ
jgi:hypothetical protein